MRIYPSEIEIGEKEGFTPKTDLFGQASLGHGMTNLVTAISEPLVIAFDGKWGTGKTTFLKMWAGELRKKEIPVILFDAFENDFSNDAFAVLVREIILLAKTSEQNHETEIGKFKDNAIKIGAQLAPVAAKLGMKALIRAATLGTLKDSDLKDALSEVINESGDVAEDYMRSILSEPEKQKNMMSEFRKALEKLPKLLSSPKDKEPQKPLVFIIDELDRCKPLFALEILERIKHFLSVPNVHFVFGVHLEQLQRSVKFAYGADINANAYLQKFINLTVSSMNEPIFGQQTNIQKYIVYLKSSLQFPTGHDMDALHRFVERAAMRNEFSYRQLERIYSNLMLTAAFNNDGLYWNSPLIAGLSILKVTKPELFMKAKIGKLTYEEINDAFGFSRLSSAEMHHSPDYDKNCWEIALLDPIPESLMDLAIQEMHKCDFENLKELVIYTANHIVGRLNLNN